MTTRVKLHSKLANYRGACAHWRGTLALFLCLFGIMAIGSLTHAFAQEQRAPWPSESFRSQDRTPNVAGDFDYYALVMSWSPTYCATADQPDNQQCERRDGRRFAFVLHGLWPQYDRGYPQNCRLRRRPFVPEETIDSMLDIMPSRGLIIHEYRKHGTCSGLDANSYYRLSRQLFQRIRIPDKYRNPMELQFTTPQDLRRDFVRANPDLPGDSIAISCARGNRARLREVRICFDRSGKPKSCGSNENARRLCSANEVFVPPVRSSARERSFGDDSRSEPPSGGQRQQEIPRPRLIEGLRGI